MEGTTAASKSRAKCQSSKEERMEQTKAKSKLEINGRVVAPKAKTALRMKVFGKCDAKQEMIYCGLHTATARQLL